MADAFGGLTDEALQSYLQRTALEREQQLVFEEREGEWFAELRGPNPPGGQAVIEGANGNRSPSCDVAPGAGHR
jgi:hypothetical protein